MESKHFFGFFFLPFLVVSSRLHFISVMKRKSSMKLYPRRYSNGCQPDSKGKCALKRKKSLSDPKLRGSGGDFCTHQINDVAPAGWGGAMGAAARADPRITPW